MSKSLRLKSKTQKGWRKFAADFAVLALLTQILAPVLLGFGAQAASPSDELSGLRVICSAHGVIYLQSDDADGSPPVAVDCPFCQLDELKGGSLASDGVSIPIVQNGAPGFAVREAGRVSKHWVLSAPNRAPPV